MQHKHLIASKYKPQDIITLISMTKDMNEIALIFGEHDEILKNAEWWLRVKVMNQTFGQFVKCKGSNWTVEDVVKLSYIFSPLLKNISLEQLLDLNAKLKNSYESCYTSRGLLIAELIKQSNPILITVEQLVKILEILPMGEEAAFARRYQSIISNGKELMLVLACLPEQDKKNFKNEQDAYWYHQATQKCAITFLTAKFKPYENTQLHQFFNHGAPKYIKRKILELADLAPASFLSQPEPENERNVKARIV